MTIVQTIRTDLMVLSEDERLVLEDLMQRVDAALEGRRAFEGLIDLKDGEQVFLKVHSESPVYVSFGKPGTLGETRLRFEPGDVYLIDRTKMELLWEKTVFQQLVESNQIELWIGDMDEALKRSGPSYHYDPGEQLGFRGGVRAGRVRRY